MRRFTQAEVNFLLKNYRSIGCAKCARRLKRSSDVVNAKARKLGLTRKTFTEYTAEEEAIIRKWFPTWGVKKCSEFLPNRTEAAIAKHAQKLGLKLDVTQSRINNGVKNSRLPKYISISQQGYKIKRTPGGKTELIHRVIMSKHLGRELSPDEVVHHKDGNKLNNDVSNLELMTRAEHINHHRDDLIESKRSKT